MFFAIFAKGNIFVCSYLLYQMTKRVQKESNSKRANLKIRSFKSRRIEKGGNNENDRVASPVGVANHLNRKEITKIRANSQTRGKDNDSLKSVFWK